MQFLVLEGINLQGLDYYTLYKVTQPLKTAAEIIYSSCWGRQTSVCKTHLIQKHSMMCTSIGLHQIHDDVYQKDILRYLYKGIFTHILATLLCIIIDIKVLF